MLEPDLRDFIRAAIRSVWALELLLLMRGGGDRAWGRAELVREMRASEPLVGELLKTFETAGLVRRVDGERFGYAPASRRLARLACDLERAYRERPVSVVNAIAAAADPGTGGDG